MFRKKSIEFETHNFQTTNKNMSDDDVEKTPPPWLLEHSVNGGSAELFSLTSWPSDEEIETKKRSRSKLLTYFDSDDSRAQHPSYQRRIRMCSLEIIDSNSTSTTNNNNNNKQSSTTTATTESIPNFRALIHPPTTETDKDGFKLFLHQLNLSNEDPLRLQTIPNDGILKISFTRHIEFQFPFSISKDLVSNESKNQPHLWISLESSDKKQEQQKTTISKKNNKNLSDNNVEMVDSNISPFNFLKIILNENNDMKKVERIYFVWKSEEKGMEIGDEEENDQHRSGKKRKLSNNNDKNSEFVVKRVKSNNDNDNEDD